MLGWRESGGFALAAVIVVMSGCTSNSNATDDPIAFPNDSGAQGDAGCTPDGAGGANCAPIHPEGTPAEKCPSGRYAGGDDFRGEGVCLPEYPRLEDWECPDDWVRKPGFVDDEGAEDVPEGMEQFHYCEPPPLPDSCPKGKMPVLGETECEPIGLECPSDGDRFHDASTIRDRAPNFDGDILYVDAEATGSASGERSSPYPSLSNALSEASEGDILALAPTDFEEAVELDGEIAVVGSCAAKSRVVAPSPAEGTESAILRAASGEVRVSDLALTGPRYGLAAGNSGAPSVSIQSTRIFDTEGVGLIANGGASVDVTKTVVRSTQPRRSDGTLGRGIGFQFGASGTLDRVLVEANHEIGLFALGAGTKLERANEVIIRETRARPADGIGGWGIGVERGAAASFRRVLVDDNQSFGLYASRGATLTEAVDVVVRGTDKRSADGKVGIGFQLEGGSTASLEQVLLEDNRSAGLRATGSDTTLEAAENIVVQETRAEAARKTRGRGFAVEAGAHASARRVFLARNREVGLLVRGDETTLAGIEDFVVWKTRTQAADSGVFGWGISVQNGAVATLRRALVEGNRTIGLVATQEGTSLREATDVTVRNTRARPSNGLDGYGMTVQRGASASLHRVQLVRNRNYGLLGLGPKTTIDPASDVVVNDTRPSRATEEGGRGIQLQSGVAASFRRAYLLSNHAVGLNISSGAAVRESHNLVVRDTETRVSDDGYGDGVYVDNGSFRAKRAVVEGNARNGFVFTGAEDSRLAEARVTNNRIGVTRELENDLELVDVQVAGNEKDDRRCSQQCYEQPEDADRIDPAGDE